MLNKCSICRVEKCRFEFLHGRPLEPEELDLIRQQLESGFDEISAVDPELRAIVARNWPHLLAKLPPDNDNDEADQG